jgi:hypothetical protein
MSSRFVDIVLRTELFIAEDFTHNNLHLFSTMASFVSGTYVVSLLYYTNYYIVRFHEYSYHSGIVEIQSWLTLVFSARQATRLILQRYSVGSMKMFRNVATV